LAAGNYTFKAAFSGDANYNAAISADEPLSIGQGGSMTSTIIKDSTNTAIVNPAALGTTVHDTATVSVLAGGPAPTGTLTYEFFTTVNGTGPHVDQTVMLVNGQVPDSSAHGPLGAGFYSFIAVYSGDANYQGSTGEVEPLTVSRARSR